MTVSSGANGQHGRRMGGGGRWCMGSTWGQSGGSLRRSPTHRSSGPCTPAAPARPGRRRRSASAKVRLSVHAIGMAAVAGAPSREQRTLNQFSNSSKVTVPSPSSSISAKSRSRSNGGSNSICPSCVETVNLLTLQFDRHMPWERREGASNLQTGPPTACRWRCGRTTRPLSSAFGPSHESSSSPARSRNRGEFCSDGRF